MVPQRREWGRGTATRRSHVRAAPSPAHLQAPFLAGRQPGGGCCPPFQNPPFMPQKQPFHLQAVQNKRHRGDHRSLGLPLLGSRFLCTELGQQQQGQSFGVSHPLTAGTTKTRGFQGVQGDPCAPQGPPHPSPAPARALSSFAHPKLRARRRRRGGEKHDFLFSSERDERKC